MACRLRSNCIRGNILHQFQTGLAWLVKSGSIETTPPGSAAIHQESVLVPDLTLFSFPLSSPSLRYLFFSFHPHFHRPC